MPNFRSKTRIQSIVSDLATQNQSKDAGSILKEIIQKSFEEIKEMIQDQGKQPFQQNKKSLLNQDLFETKIDQLKKELKQIQLQQFHEIRNQQRQLFNQQSRETKVSFISKDSQYLLLGNNYFRNLSPKIMHYGSMGCQVSMGGI